MSAAMAGQAPAEAEGHEARRAETSGVASLSPRTRQGDQASLIVKGRDRPGIVGVIGSTLSRNSANIVALDQYSDNPQDGAFFQRTVFGLDHLKSVLPALEEDLRRELEDFDLEFTLRDMSVPKRMAIFASKSDHCLLELLWRHRRGELNVSIPMVISNHANVAAEVRQFGIPFFHVPCSGPDKSAAEAEHLRLLQGNVDFIVLARYMQILSADFIKNADVPIINIHHSFLPAFIGAGPYAQAKQGHGKVAFTQREAALVCAAGRGGDGGWPLLCSHGRPGARD